VVVGLPIFVSGHSNLPSGWHAGKVCRFAADFPGAFGDAGGNAGFSRQKANSAAVLPRERGVPYWNMRFQCIQKILQIISWQFFSSGVETNCSLKWMDVVHPPSQSSVREPGGNPGRLRHCNGYKFPKPLPRHACMSGGGKAE